MLLQAQQILREQGRIFIGTEKIHFSCEWPAKYRQLGQAVNVEQSIWTSSTRGASGPHKSMHEHFSSSTCTNCSATTSHDQSREQSFAPCPVDGQSLQQLCNVRAAPHGSEALIQCYRWLQQQLSHLLHCHNSSQSLLCGVTICFQKQVVRVSVITAALHPMLHDKSASPQFMGVNPNCEYIIFDLILCGHVLVFQTECAIYIHGVSILCCVLINLTAS